MNLEKYLCPICEGTDRDRLYALYLEMYFSELSQTIDLIEFAPTRQLRTFISRFVNVQYRSADLNSPLADDNVDMTSMSIYPDSSFDFFICSHVLEHIENDRAAVSELYRITKPGGKGILMVPIDLSLKENYENPEAVTDGQRWGHFCQFDHLRLYSKSGFLSLLRDAGFEVEQLREDHFGKKVFERCGVHFRSVLYIASRKADL